MISVYLDTSPLTNGHSGRGIGMYTKFLLEELAHHPEVQVITDHQAGKKADLTHFPFFDLFFATLPVPYSKQTVVTIHDVIPLEFPEYYKPGVKGKLNFYRQKFALRFVKQVITDSHFSKQKINELLGIPLEKITVVYLAANPALTAQPPSKVEAVKKMYKLPKEYLLYVGDINYNKNIPQLIKALKFLPSEIELVCVGRNFKEQEIPEWQWIATQIEMSEVSKRVTFLPDIGSDETETLAAVYSGALAYVQPSLSEGFGLPILDAFQCKTPVISSSRGSLLEVGGNVPLYVEPTAEAIAEAVCEIMNWSERHRKEVLDMGLEQVARFSWRETALKTIEVYQKVTVQ